MWGRKDGYKDISVRINMARYKDAKSNSFRVVIALSSKKTIF